MQILKRLKKFNFLNAQNLIEFIFILPILLFLTLVIFEVALFWQETNAIYNLNAEINANLALIDVSQVTELGKRCVAATKAFEILKDKQSGISLSNATFNDSADINSPTLVPDGKEPFALYKFQTPNTITDNNGVSKPQIALWVDCRNPFEQGFVTQIEFYHKTVIMKATIPRFDSGPPLVVIPENIFVASPKLSTLRHY